jgi:hypothetical protein
LQQIVDCGAGLGEAISRIGLHQPGPSKVDLPEPLRPTRQTRSPDATASSAPVSSGVTPKVTLMSCSRSNGGGMPDEISRDGPCQ